MSTSEHKEVEVAPVGDSADETDSVQDDVDGTVTESAAHRYDTMPTGWYAGGVVHPKDRPTPGPAEEEATKGVDLTIRWDEYKSGPVVNKEAVKAAEGRARARFEAERKQRQVGTARRAVATARKR
jgi:hypothetical protein